MRINKIGGPSFGKKNNQQEMWKRTFGDEVISRQTKDVVELKNGKTVVINTLYDGDKVTHKVTTLWDKSNNTLKAVIKEWFLGEKKPPNHAVHDENLK